MLKADYINNNNNNVRTINNKTYRTLKPYVYETSHTQMELVTMVQETEQPVCKGDRAGL